MRWPEYQCLGPTADRRGFVVERWRRVWWAPWRWRVTTYSNDGRGWWDPEGWAFVGQKEEHPPNGVPPMEIQVACRKAAEAWRQRHAWPAERSDTAGILASLVQTETPFSCARVAELLEGAARQNGRRAAYVKIRVPDEVAKAIQGRASARRVEMFVVTVAAEALKR